MYFCSTMMFSAISASVKVVLLKNVFKHSSSSTMARSRSSLLTSGVVFAGGFRSSTSIKSSSSPGGLGGVGFNSEGLAGLRLVFFFFGVSQLEGTPSNFFTVVFSSDLGAGDSCETVAMRGSVSAVALSTGVSSLLEMAF